jgi:hypothetical protein
MAKLLEQEEIPGDKIWLAAGLSAFLYLYTSILGSVGTRALYQLLNLALSS